METRSDVHCSVVRLIAEWIRVAVVVCGASISEISVLYRKAFAAIADSIAALERGERPTDGEAGALAACIVDTARGYGQKGGWTGGSWTTPSPCSYRRCLTGSIGGASGRSASGTGSMPRPSGRSRGRLTTSTSASTTIESATGWPASSKTSRTN